MKKSNTNLNPENKIDGLDSDSAAIRKSYNPEFKRQILEVWESGAYASVPECAKSYGLNENTLYNWIHKAKAKPSNTSNPEITKLRKELARAKMELEILKKAAIYFANSAS